MVWATPKNTVFSGKNVNTCFRMQYWWLCLSLYEIFTQSSLNDLQSTAWNQTLLLLLGCSGELQLETKGNDGYALSCSLQAFCSCFCSKKCLYTQTQCFHCSIWKPISSWHSEVRKQNKIKSLALLYCWTIISGTYYFPITALISIQ